MRRKLTEHGSLHLIIRARTKQLGIARQALKAVRDIRPGEPSLAYGVEAIHELSGHDARLAECPNPVCRSVASRLAFDPRAIAEKALAASIPGENDLPWNSERGGWRNASGRKNGKLGGRPVQELPCRKCLTATTKRDASRRPDCGC